MYSTELKIKRLSLAAEARIIKAEEVRALGGKWVQRDDSPKLTKIRRRGYPKLERFTNLHEHRMNVVRVQARAAHLAHGYLRGRPCLMMEGGARTKPAIEVVVENLRTFGGAQFHTMEKTKLFRAVEDWIEGSAPIKVAAPAEGAGTLNPVPAGSIPAVASTGR
jgi:hypothetical protein